MSVRQYRKRPVVIEAAQWEGTFESSDALLDWAHGQVTHHFNHQVLTVQTLEGEMTAQVGDWIIKGVAGEFYPVKDPIFQATYELVE